MTKIKTSVLLLYCTVSPAPRLLLAQVQRPGVSAGREAFPMMNFS